MNPLVRRQRAVQETFTRFNGRPLRHGRGDCAQMAAYLLRRLWKGDKDRLAALKALEDRAGAYRSRKAAGKTLEALGAHTLADLMDRLDCPRIAPAAALPGDLLGLPAPEGQIALFMALERGEGFGTVDGYFVRVDVLMAATAWRPL